MSTPYRLARFAFGFIVLGCLLLLPGSKLCEPAVESSTLFNNGGSRLYFARTFTAVGTATTCSRPSPGTWS